MERIQNDADMQVNSKEIQEGLSVCGVRLSVAAPHHQGINIQVEATWRTLQIIAHSIMVHARVSE